MRDDTGFSRWERREVGDDGGNTREAKRPGNCNEHCPQHDMCRRTRRVSHMDPLIIIRQRRIMKECRDECRVQNWMTGVGEIQVCTMKAVGSEVLGAQRWS